MARGRSNQDTPQKSRVPVAQMTRYGRPMSQKPQPAQIQELLRLLHASYGGAECALDHRNAYELLAATILSAQCTDKRVNMVTPALFARFPTPERLAEAELAEVEDLVRTTGFFRNKAKNLIGMAQGLVRDHGGQVPGT